MKLKMLALVVGCLAMPIISGAQDTTAKDSAAMASKSAKATKKAMKKHMKKHDMEMKGEEHEDMAMKTGTGPECARGCPTSSGVAGLTGVQFLALQQELRDRGCGNVHVTGVLDAPTKAAIKVCAKKLNVEANAGAVLTAMNIGYTVGAGT